MVKMVKTKLNDKKINLTKLTEENDKLCHEQLYLLKKADEHKNTNNKLEKEIIFKQKIITKLKNYLLDLEIEKKSWLKLNNNIQNKTIIAINKQVEEKNKEIITINKEITNHNQAMIAINKQVEEKNQKINDIHKKISDTTHDIKIMEREIKDFAKKEEEQKNETAIKKLCIKNDEISKKIIILENERNKKYKNIFFKIISLGFYDRKTIITNAIEKLKLDILNNNSLKTSLKLIPIERERKAKETQERIENAQKEKIERERKAKEEEKQKTKTAIEKLQKEKIEIAESKIHIWIENAQKETIERERKAKETQERIERERKEKETQESIEREKKAIEKLQKEIKWAQDFIQQIIETNDHDELKHKAEQNLKQFELEQEAFRGFPINCVS